MIQISRPTIGDAEQLAVSRVLASGVLAQGPQVAAFEQEFARYIGVEHAIATSSGTSALHAVLLALGVGPGDEVITSPFTFIASVNSILYAGATPVFADIGEDFNIDPALIAPLITARTRAIMPVHLYGQVASMREIMRIAHDHDLLVVEDACQAHGAKLEGRAAGSFSVGCFSFYATKNMTTGEGGAITTNDGDLTERCRMIINHGMRRRYHHEILGYNYRMTDLAAAIGREQLKCLDQSNSRRVENAASYNKLLAGCPGLILPAVGPNREHVYHQYTVRITPQFGRTRDEVADLLKAEGVATGIYYPVPAHLQASIQSLGLKGGRLPVAEQMATEVLSLPVHPSLADGDVAFVASKLLSLSRQ